MQNSDSITVLEGDFKGYYVETPNRVLFPDRAINRVFAPKIGQIGSYTTHYMPMCCGALIISNGLGASHSSAMMAAISATSKRQSYRSLFATAVDDSEFDRILKIDMVPDSAGVNVRTGRMINSYAWSP